MVNIIKSKENNIIKSTSKLFNSSKIRRETNKFVIEGARLCSDAALSGVKIDSLFYTKESIEKYGEYANLILKKANKIYSISPAIMGCITDTKSPQGIVCVCSMLDKQINCNTINNKGKFIALENIQDPSNLGTILRTAEALGISGVILSNDCCDIYNPKVLRGSMGAIFRLPFYLTNNIYNEILTLNKLGFLTYAAVPNSSAQPINNIGFKEGSIAVIGNEGNGLTNEVINVCTKKITIPMLGRAESLNAATAASIIMWEIMH